MPLPGPDKHLGTLWSRHRPERPTEIHRDLGRGDRRGDDGGSGGGHAASRRRSRSPRPLRRQAPPYCGVSPAGRAGGERSRRRPPRPTRAGPERRGAAVLTREERRERDTEREPEPPPTSEARPRPAIYKERPPPAARRPLSRERRERHRRRTSPPGAAGRGVTGPGRAGEPEGGVCHSRPAAGQEGRASAKKRSLSEGNSRSTDPSEDQF